MASVWCLVGEDKQPQRPIRRFFAALRMTVLGGVWVRLFCGGDGEGGGLGGGGVVAELDVEGGGWGAGEGEGGIDKALGDRGGLGVGEVGRDGVEEEEVVADEGAGCGGGRRGGWGGGGFGWFERQRGTG